MRSQASDFLRRMDIRYPIIQAPMAGASTPLLAAVVTNLSGLGSLALGSASLRPETISKGVNDFQTHLKGISADTNIHTFNANFFAHATADDSSPEAVRRSGQWCSVYRRMYSEYGVEPVLAAEELSKQKLNLPYPSFTAIGSDTSHETIALLKRLAPKMVSFHFGIPHESLLRAIQGSSMVFVAVTSVPEFKQAVSAGVDGVILQGWEAGGHRGNFLANDPEDEMLSTEDLARAVVSCVDAGEIEGVPFIVAAGGVYDSQGVNRLLDLGVAAVQLGTVWLPTTGCTISERHRELIVNPSNPPLETSMNYKISGRNLRTINSELLQKLDDQDGGDVPEYPLPYSIFKKFVADCKGSNAGGSYLAGGNYHRVWMGTDDPREVFKRIVDGVKWEK